MTNVIWGCVTTRAFYSWLRDHSPKCRVLGLSATPPSTASAPDPRLSNILTRYSIYDAVRDNVIVPLKIAWSAKHIRCDDPTQVCGLILQIAISNGHRKIIVWAGTIRHCHAMAHAWNGLDKRMAFSNSMIALDVSVPSKEYSSYADFRNASSGVLFCAALVHREGSDISGLSMAVFVDGVEKELHQRLFSVLVVSCDEVRSKTFGLIVDVRAKDGMELCDRMNRYLVFHLVLCHGIYPPAPM